MKYNNTPLSITRRVAHSRWGQAQPAAYDRVQLEAYGHVSPCTKAGTHQPPASLVFGFIRYIEKSLAGDISEQIAINFAVLQVFHNSSFISDMLFPDIFGCADDGTVVDSL